MPGQMLDIFGDAAFSFTTLTDAISHMPFNPGQAGIAADWEPEGIPTTTAAIEEISGELTLLNPLARGGPGASFEKNYRTEHFLKVPHYQENGAIYADEVQGVRAFGQVSQLQTIADMVNTRMSQMVQLRFNPTLEYQRLGALKGNILNWDGSTLYNLFQEFDVSQAAEVDFNLDATIAAGAPATSGVRATCAAVRRTIANALGGLPFNSIKALCSPEFFDALIGNGEIRTTYLNQVEAAQLRSSYAFGGFSFGGIDWEEYRGAANNSSGDLTQFITANKCHIFPVGVPGLYRTVYAPADYSETVNTPGLPRYAKQIAMDNDKGVRLEMQMNALNYCTRPNVLIQGKTT